jgi:serine protease Do
MRHLKKLILVFFLLALVAAASPAHAQRGGRISGSNLRDGRDVRAAFQTVVATADAGTVRVVCSGRDAALGAVVGSDGWIITKYSELREPIVCRFIDGRQLAARVVGYDPGYDLAMLKIDATGLKTVEWADDDHGPAVGQLLATASPGELPLAIGVVSVPRRPIPPRSRLGIGFDHDQNKPQIDEVLSGSPAEQAGLKVGDTVIQANGKPVGTSEELVEIIHQFKPGDQVALLIKRGEDQLKITATLKRPEEVGTVSRSDRMNEMGGPLSYRSSSFPSVIQHDTVLRPADCGGPLVDLSGKVVGINIARAGRTESYAAPADQVRHLLADLESGRLAPKNSLPGKKETINTGTSSPDDKKADDKKASS